MASARHNFREKLKKEAHKSEIKTKVHHSNNNIRDESPVARELNAEENLVLQDIIEDSEPETSFYDTEVHVSKVDFMQQANERRDDGLYLQENDKIEGSDSEDLHVHEYSINPARGVETVIEIHTDKVNFIQQTEDQQEDACLQGNEHNQIPELEYENALLHSVNPALGVDSAPESPSLLTNNNISKNVANDLPIFSPFVTDQNILSHSDCIQETPVQSPSLQHFRIVAETASSTESLSPERVVNKKRDVRKRIDKGRVRTVHKNKWLDVKRKNYRNSGQHYVSRNGTPRNKRILGPPCKDTCRLKCSTKFDLAQRQQLFSNFWKMGDLVRQWDYINKYCNKIAKRRCTTETDSKRQFTLQYHLPKEVCDDDNSAKIKVCKPMFLNTFNIKEGLVYSAIQKLNAEGSVSKDGRGLHKNHKIVITEDMKSSVRDHVKSFAPIESHYVRTRSSKLYLEGSLSIARMYLLYQEWEDTQNREKVKTERQYRDILNENFNIGFYIPKKDQCDVCLAYKNTVKPAEKEEYLKNRAHILNKTIAREMKQKDKEIAKTNKTDTISAVYDFQKVHGLPYCEASTLYYKRKLTVFNFTIYDLGNSVGTCYVWDETVAKRGANEVASCIYDFIATHSEKGIKTFNFYSDNCGGQNRNRIVFAAYMRAARDYQVKISHKYLEKGHTQNEGDSVHALIERSAKTKTIYTPSQWYAMIRWAKQDNNPYIVKEMDNLEFLDFKILLPNCNWTKDTSQNTVQWSKIRQLEIYPENSGCIFFKTDFCNHEFSCINIDISDQGHTSRKKTRGRGKTKETPSIPMHSRRLVRAYETKLMITKSKKNDLLYLCKHKIIPLTYHSYYENLPEGEVIVDNEDDYSTTVLP